MQHVLFARFADRRQALSAMESIRHEAGSGTEMQAHFDVEDDASFAESVQHSGLLAESDLRHARIVGATAGLAAGALGGLALHAVGIFPGTLGQGAVFGAFMGVLVGLVMMSVFGAGLMDRRLRQLAKGIQSQDVVLTVRTPDLPSCERARRSLEQCGAKVAEKSKV
jgi:hypothetical protein